MPGTAAGLPSASRVSGHRRPADVRVVVISEHGTIKRGTLGSILR
jgi:hypothetical protein